MTFSLSTIKIQQGDFQHGDYFVINKELAMPLFEHFGPYITELLIECADELNTAIGTVILRRCTANLMGLDLVRLKENDFEGTQKM